jgi:hypothetical protein
LKQVDADALFREINEVFKKYGVDRGVGFVPDRLDISLERRGMEGFSLAYTERFTYLPQDVMEFSLENAVQLLVRMGVPQDRITRLGDGVRVELSGDAGIIQFPVLEMLIQDRNTPVDLKPVCSSLERSMRALSALFDFAWEYGEETRERWSSSVQRLSEIIEQNPGLQEEIEEIMRRHTGGDAGEPRSPGRSNEEII